MKKYILSSIVIASIITTSLINYFHNKKEVNFIDLGLVNIEATAAGEGGSGVSCFCGKVYGKGCKADNSGSSCNPSGSSDCWSYNQNCS